MAFGDAILKPEGGQISKDGESSTYPNYTNTADSDVNAGKVPKGSKRAEPITPSVVDAHGVVMATKYTLLMRAMTNRDKEVERLREVIKNMPQITTRKYGERLVALDTEIDLAYYKDVMKLIQVENEELNAKLKEYDEKDDVWKRTLEHFKDVR